MHYLDKSIWFPDVDTATEDGLLAIGGDLSIKRLVYAYKRGVFPWFEDNQPILWWSPDPRMVLFPEELKVSKSMKQVLRNSNFMVTINKAFKEVIRECSLAKREGQSGTWITKEMIDAYTKLYELGYAKSVEVWLEDELVGGLYGVDLGAIFCGESMFARVSNASKVAFITFLQNSNYVLVDCQVYTAHLSSLGAREIPRKEFIHLLTANS